MAIAYFFLLTQQTVWASNGVARNGFLSSFAFTCLLSRNSTLDSTARRLFGCGGAAVWYFCLRFSVVHDRCF